jgi:uncharacterized protein YjbI with pentapeptide repeats
LLLVFYWRLVQQPFLDFGPAVIQQPQKQSKTKPVYFSGSQFFGKANFREAKFEGEVDFIQTKFQGEAAFDEAKFQGEVDFSAAKFSGESNFRSEFKDKASFNYVLFEGKEKVIFDIENLSNVSFMNTDITGVRFSDKA